MQPQDLVDGEFEIGLDCCEIDLLGMRTRPGEAMVIVWHVHGMPDDGCFIVNPQNATPNGAAEGSASPSARGGARALASCYTFLMN